MNAKDVDRGRPSPARRREWAPGGPEPGTEETRYLRVWSKTVILYGRERV